MRESLRDTHSWSYSFSLLIAVPLATYLGHKANQLVCDSAARSFLEEVIANNCTLSNVTNTVNTCIKSVANCTDPETTNRLAEHAANDAALRVPADVIVHITTVLAVCFAGHMLIKKNDGRLTHAADRVSNAFSGAKNTLTSCLSSIPSFWPNTQRNGPTHQNSDTAPTIQLGLMSE